MINFLNYNIVVELVRKIFRQTVGILMVTNCAPSLFCFCFHMHRLLFSDNIVIINISLNNRRFPITFIVYVYCIAGSFRGGLIFSVHWRRIQQFVNMITKLRTCTWALSNRELYLSILTANSTHYTVLSITWKQRHHIIFVYIGRVHVPIITAW